MRINVKVLWEPAVSNVKIHVAILNSNISSSYMGSYYIFFYNTRWIYILVFNFDLICFYYLFIHLKLFFWKNRRGLRPYFEFIKKTSPNTEKITKKERKKERREKGENWGFYETKKRNFNGYCTFYSNFLFYILLIHLYFLKKVLTPRLSS